jgi:hypothetical protein
MFSLLMGVDNAGSPERLHYGSVLLSEAAAEWKMRKAGLLVMLLLAGCMSSQPRIRPLRPLEIATAPYREVATAATTGSLMYEGGCLLFHEEETGALVMPVWPSGSSFNGTAVLFHHPGKMDQRIVVAEEFQMAGEPLEWGALGNEAYQPIQHQCGAYSPFFVSAVRPAD